MRSRRDYIVTKDEVYSYANDWLRAALRLEYEGAKCTAGTLFQVLLIAAARVVSLFAACRDLADAPSDQTIRNALAASLPEIVELERRLNRALATQLPKALRRKARMVTIDLTLIPYYGRPGTRKRFTVGKHKGDREAQRGKHKGGSTKGSTKCPLSRPQNVGFVRLILHGFFDQPADGSREVVLRRHQVVLDRNPGVKYAWLESNQRPTV